MKKREFDVQVPQIGPSRLTLVFTVEAKNPRKAIEIASKLPSFPKHFDEIYIK